MTAEEHWRDVPGYPGYSASSLGRVRGKTGRVMTPCRGSWYLVVCVVVGGGSKTIAVHAIVCAAFHGLRPDGMEAAHGDGNRDNNRPDNLRWATSSENHRDAIRHGTHRGLANKGEGHGAAKLTDSAIQAIRARPKTWGVQAHLAAEYGVAPSLISGIRAGSRWKHIETAAQ